MQKIVAIVSQDDLLKKMMERVKERSKHFDQRKEFLQKQLEDLVEQAHGEIRPLINEVQNYLEDQGKMPAEFNRNTHHTHWDEDMDVILVCSGEHNNNNGGNPLIELLKRL